MAGVAVRHMPNKSVIETFKYSSKKFHKDAGYDIIKRERERLTGDVEETHELSREALKYMVTPADLPLELKNLEVLQFREKVNAHMTTATARLRRKKKIRTRMALDHFASLLAPNVGRKKGRTRLFYGSGFGVGFGMRG